MTPALGDCGTRRARRRLCGLAATIVWLAAVFVWLAPSGAAADLVILTDGYAHLEASAVETTATGYRIDIAGSGARDLPRAAVAAVLPGETFTSWTKARLAEPGKVRPDEGALLLAALLGARQAGELEAAARDLARDLAARFPESPFFAAVRDDGRPAIDPWRWIRFDYRETIDQWVDAEGENTPRFELTVDQFRHLEGFWTWAGSHGYQILGMHFFKEQRGLRPVLTNAWGEMPRGWPAGLVPGYTLRGTLKISQASPNRFFQRIVQHHFHVVLDVVVVPTAQPERVLFAYQAARVGMHSNKAEAALEVGSRRLLIRAFKDEALHAAPTFTGAATLTGPPPPRPEFAQAMPELHAKLPPLFDPVPHYDFEAVKAAADAEAAARAAEGGEEFEEPDAGAESEGGERDEPNDR